MSRQPVIAIVWALLGVTSAAGAADHPWLLPPGLSKVSEDAATILITDQDEPEELHPPTIISDNASANLPENIPDVIPAVTATQLSEHFIAFPQAETPLH